MSRIIFISNRLPVTVEKRKQQLVYKKSVGGLATGLNSIGKSLKAVWIGWCGLSSNSVDYTQRKAIENKLRDDHNCHTLFLTRKSIKSFYSGFCNKTIWPLFHYFPNNTQFDNSLWESYKHVNRHFCYIVKQVAEPDDILWVHDYQLMLLPQLLREAFPQNQIGFFLHIPFPSYELFRLLPWRHEILQGMLGADLAGFHTYDYVRHFNSSVRRILGLDHHFDQIQVGHRTVKTDAFPMGIQYQEFASAESNFEYVREIQRTCNPYDECKLILSVDRLDYTKGIAQRLEAFDRFLEKYPDLHQKVTLVLVAVPSRTNVEHYSILKKRVDELIGYINGKYGTLGWMPVWYFYRFLSFNNLTSLYKLADIALVTPLRDGMNLIAKEYVAAKTEMDGVLILSEMAGAVAELSEAVVVNPNDKEAVADAIYYAIHMPHDVQKERMKIMQERIKRYNVKTWADDFLTRLSYAHSLQIQHQSKYFNEESIHALCEDYQKAKHRLIFLDYDGTLVPCYTKPSQALPDDEIQYLIRTLANKRRNEVVIISGRDRETMQSWLGRKKVGLAAEHGAWIREKNGEWHMLESIDDAWKAEIHPILEMYVNRTPGSVIEEKSFSMAWHYRKTDPELGHLRKEELKEALLGLTANLDLKVIEGNKVLEIKYNSIHKGRTANYWTSNKKLDFILAFGDDWTDEDLFEAMPRWAYSIKVGPGLSRARYYLSDYQEVRNLLKILCDIKL